MSLLMTAVGYFFNFNKELWRITENIDQKGNWRVKETEETGLSGIDGGEEQERERLLVLNVRLESEERMVSGMRVIGWRSILRR